MNDRLLSFLGICRRAKKLVIGAEITAQSVEEGKSLLVLYASDASKNSLKRVLAAAEQNGVTAACVSRSKDELSAALGRLCAVMSIEDKGFADKLSQMILSEQRGEFYDKVQG